MNILKKNWPIIESDLAALGIYFLMLWHYAEFYHQYGLLIFTQLTLLGFFYGSAYTNIFEYLHHRFIQHARKKISMPILKILNPFVEFLKENHRLHHRVFRGNNFRSDNPEHLKHITLDWWVFPLYFSIHYLIFLWLASFRYIQYAPALFSGIFFRFLIYENPHFLTHSKDNAIDRFILRIPILGKLRQDQIDHHEDHHKIPEGNFSFAPLYLDRFFKTKLKLQKT